MINVDEHNAATMAPHSRTQRCFGFAFTFLWLAVLITSSADSTSAAPIEAFISREDTVTYQRAERSPDEETFQPRIPKKVDDYEIAEEDLNETQVTSQESSSDEVPLDNEDEVQENPQLRIKEQNKNKQSEPKKYNGNDLKKVSVEIKTSNDSASEKQKLPAYNPNPVIKYNSSFKKDSKLNSSFSDYNFKADNSDLKVPSKLMKKKGDTIEGSTITTKSTKLNETRLMSDQPIATESDVAHNTTDVADEEALDGFVQNSTSSSEDNSTSPDGRTMPSDDLNVVLISSVTLGTAVLLGVVAGGGFVFYRHRMWNKPQTLSDKCSNADSSGYIDDSTLRENSEEMYSLDNDSFLNSLEAMTIQNYWTDNVKHTKL